MSYRFRRSYESYVKGGVDLIIPTKKGLEEGAVQGIILPIGYVNPAMARLSEFYSDIQKFVDEIWKSKKYNIYIAKHCDNPDVLTHITPDGIVNRFGLCITPMDVLSVKKDWCIDVGTGWYKRKTVKNLDEIISLIKDFEPTGCV